MAFFSRDVSAVLLLTLVPKALFVLFVIKTIIYIKVHVLKIVRMESTMTERHAHVCRVTHRAKNATEQPTTSVPRVHLLHLLHFYTTIGAWNLVLTLLSLTLIENASLVLLNAPPAQASKMESV